MYEPSARLAVTGEQLQTAYPVDNGVDWAQVSPGWWFVNQRQRAETEPIRPVAVLGCGL